MTRVLGNAFGKTLNFPDVLAIFVNRKNAFEKLEFHPLDVIERKNRSINFPGKRITYPKPIYIADIYKRLRSVDDVGKFDSVFVGYIDFDWILIFCVENVFNVILFLYIFFSAVDCSISKIVERLL